MQGATSAPPQATPAQQYRPDIDGLRAIAVLAVILFHVGAPCFDGGFVGVDIFFVLSGYLITQILAREMDAGSFTIVGFYERRVRRIIPALFVMLFISSALGYLFLIPSFYTQFTQSAAAAALSLSNVYFYKHSGYFDISADLVPLLHTWSLGVEEQFYIVLPILFFVARRLSRLSWGAIISTLFAASLIFGVVETYFDIRTLMHGRLSLASVSTAAFYLPASRCWEFLTGSALAVGLIPHVRRDIHREVLALAGLALIAAGVLGFNRDTAFPGVMALAPCLGSAMVIHAQLGATSLVGRALRAPPMVWIGLVSYSLYLWHWPMLAFVRLLWGSELPLVAYVALLLSMFPVAWLSWRFVERPPRRDRRRFTRSRLFFGAGLGASILLAIALIVARTDGAPQRFGPAALAIAAGETDTNPARAACDAKSVAQIEQGQVCTIGRQGGPVTFALLGDSFADALSPGVAAAADAAGQRGIVLTRGGCYPLVGANTGDSACRAFLGAAIAHIRSVASVRTVILVGRWSAAADASRFGAISWRNLFITDDQSRGASGAENMAVVARGLDRDAAALAGYRVAVVAYIPEQLANVPEAAAIRIQWRGALGQTGTPRAVVEQRQANARRLLTAAAIRDGFTVIDAMPALCDAATCRAVEDGRSLYSDDNHLSGFGALQEGSALAPIFAPPRPLGATAGPQAGAALSSAAEAPR
ncbi:MAG TPA: acyltransferase family protein [Caulobacteraceae bacterium]|jgi:peptidoglycan/LPS O-acetylase OafA/YrhL